MFAMTRSQFHYQQMSYLRWCYRTARLRSLLLGLPLPVAACAKPSAATWRYSTPVFEPLASVTVVLRVGAFVIGEAGDPQLSGHPDIRY